MTDRASRAQALAALGAPPYIVEELLAYTENHFFPDGPPASLDLPLASEPHVAVWEEYAQQVAAAGSLAPLRDALVQLRFPIRAGISESEVYRAATRRGVLPDPLPPDALELRGTVAITIHDHPAGRIPVLVTSVREDFVALVRAFTRRNEPALVPDSQGAAVVAGYNNWDRIARHRRAWQAAHPAAGDEAWADEFARIVPEKWRYQDRFLIVSRGPYSGVAAEELGLHEAAWQEQSVALRLEHEAVHYFTSRVLGSMKNQVHDELIADWAGIRAAHGSYRADWFLRFMGLEAYPRYREGGRLQNYRSEPAPLSDDGFAVLQTLTYRAALTLERFESTRGDDPRDQRALAIGIVRLCLVTLDTIASEDGLTHLAAAHETAERLVHWTN